MHNNDMIEHANAIHTVGSHINTTAKSAILAVVATTKTYNNYMPENCEFVRKKIGHVNVLSRKN